MERIGAVLVASVARVREAALPLGSAGAFSWPVIAIYCPLGVLIQAPANASIFGGQLHAWILASAAGMAVLAAVLAAARALVCRRAGPGPACVLVSYGIAALAQTATFGWMTVLLDVAGSPLLSFRLMGVFLQIPLLTVTGYAVARHDAHRRVMAKLERTRDRLLEVEATLDAELDRAETALVDALHASLEPAVASLEDALADAEAGREPATVIHAIDALVEEQVRPLTDRLVADAQERAPFETVAASRTRSRTRVPLPAAFRVGDALRPGIAAFVLLLAAVPTAVRALEPWSVLLYLAAFSLSSWTLLELARLTLGRARVWTVLGAPAVVCLYPAVGVAAYWLVGVAGIARPGGITVGIAGVWAVLGLTLTSDLLVETYRVRSERELERATRRLERVVALIRRRERLVKRRLAFVVHGALQGALHAAALRIVEAQAITEQLGLEIRRDIAAALSQISRGREPGASLRTPTTIDELASVWGDHRHLRVQISPTARERLVQAPDVDEAVAEVIREAVNNAFRHGAARSIELEVTSGDGDIAIAVHDDGRGHPGDGRRGFGSRLFDDLCRTWTVDTGSDGTRFHGLVALAGQRSLGPV
ncbi:unannotated protein [freshwater metagenome]|uniref:Unannotated protein n=1 Tax=freshwater metagenome TaxID=449393 RepID=A0A6J7CRC4_9ZZZZ